MDTLDSTVSIRLLIDENFNQRILRGLKLLTSQIDCVTAQGVGLSGAADPNILQWAADQQRILITHDLETIPKYAYARIKAGQKMSGAIALPKTLPIGRAIEELFILIECSEQNEWENMVVYLPL